ncbi:kinase-like domain-containing protein [Nemania sp. FL0031]|nr:kinase-like domain-containing protein [Nemania sp. FL0031]
MDFSGGEGQGWILNWRRKMFLKFQEHRTGIKWKTRVPDFPLTGQKPDVVLPGVWQQAYPYVRRSQAEANLDQYSRESRVPEKSKDAFKRLRTVKEHFAIDYPQLKYAKCLGWGGNGMAVAFHLANKDGEKPRAIVAKMIFQSYEELLEREVDAMRVFQRAEHVTQLLYVDREGLVQEGVKPRSNQEDIRDADGDHAMMDPGRQAVIPGPPRPEIHTFMMEMLESGDLAQLISRVRERNEDFPNPILWRFCLCFVRMCIALAYPPLDIDENINVIGPIRESVPQPRRPPRRWVHFDMDPKNIFIGDMRLDGEHGVTPIMKLGDFGLAREVERNRDDLYYEGLRRFAKLYFFAPEQFCIDWDFVPRGQGQIADHPIAGNFGAHTNVWALGCMMECLITKAYPAWPPNPTLTDRDPPAGKQQYYTYAGHLAQQTYGHVQPQMIDLIFRCQAHLPEDRPRLEELEESVLRMIRDNRGEIMTEQQLGDWLQAVIYEPMGAADGLVYVMDQVWREVVGNGQMNTLRGFQPLAHAGQVGPVQQPRAPPPPGGLQPRGFGAQRPEQPPAGFGVPRPQQPATGFGVPRPQQQRPAGSGAPQLQRLLAGFRGAPSLPDGYGAPQLQQLLAGLRAPPPPPPADFGAPPPRNQQPRNPPEGYLGEPVRVPPAPPAGQEDFQGVPFRARRGGRTRLFGNEPPAEPSGGPRPSAPRPAIPQADPPRPNPPRPVTAGGQRPGAQQGGQAPARPGNLNPFNQGAIQWGSSRGQGGNRGRRRSNRRWDPYRRPGSREPSREPES